MRLLKPVLFIIIVSLVTLSACNSFRHGYTWSKAENSYYLVTGNKNNFGDLRIKYNKSFHRNSALVSFLDCKCREHPDFIYEYMSDKKCRGIKLFYVGSDSVFTFEEPKKNNLHSVLKQSAKMNQYERDTYERLQTKTN